LLVDRVVEVEYGKYAVGYKNITVNDQFFNGHFPERAIMPGWLGAGAVCLQQQQQQLLQTQKQQSRTRLGKISSSMQEHSWHGAALHTAACSETQPQQLQQQQQQQQQCLEQHAILMFEEAQGLGQYGTSAFLWGAMSSGQGSG
jgi:3-hydroxymyristoyl/3-hydroxydecanoyl-(acyl carrier protein) dehydratase